MYQGPDIDDAELLAALPPELQAFLRRCNGYVAFNGGLHIRGACLEPAWHSLRAAWHGPDALHRLYPAVLESDIPFGQDAMGDQFLLRDGGVHKLFAETGELEDMEMTLLDFDHAAREDPVVFLSLEPLIEYREDGGELAPGELLAVYPPFVLSADEVEYRAVPALERLQWLASFAEQINGLDNGTTVSVERPW